MTDSRHALIIANDRYDEQGLKKLRAPAQDAASLAEVLHDPQIGDFEVEVVRNEPAHVMRRRIQRFFNDRRRNDTLVLHFSCHGLKSESGELYFAASDTDPVLLDATAVPAQFVRGCMSRTRAGSSVLFLDCCYGGAFSKGSSSVRSSGDVNVLESFKAERPGGRGWAVITASNSMEYAFEGPDLAENSAPRPSLFTHAVVQGLETGEADLDLDGEVSLDDLYDYVFERVQEQNPNQTPSKTVEMQGDLHLAHSKCRRINIIPIDLPPSLKSAISSRNAFARLGAVAELRSRLRNESLPIAEGARQALEEVARNDIRQIADEACSALREVRLQPSPARLDFGLVPRGSPPQRKSVTLAGPPLARCCVAQSTHGWLRVEESAEGLDVTVDPSTEGHLSGDIVLKGVTAEVVIRVEAVVAQEREETSPKGGDREPTPLRPPPRKSHLSPALATAALAAAVTSVITLIMAAVRAEQAVENRRAEGPGGMLETHVEAVGMLSPLTTCLITAAAALVLGAFARHYLRARGNSYTAQATGTTNFLIATTKVLAIPALILAALIGIAYLVAKGQW
ncbi:caspase family protein [Streptomyces sp. NPDC055134]